MLGAVARKLFGSANERRIRSYQPRVAEINALEKELEALSDEALRAKVSEGISTSSSAGAGNADSTSTAGRGLLLLSSSGAAKPVRENVVLALDGVSGPPGPIPPRRCSSNDGRSA